MKKTVFFVIMILMAISAKSNADEMHYIDQCRVLDTRNLGSPITNGVEYGVKVRGKVGHLQGGVQDCGILIHASGVIVNVTAVSSGFGFLEVYPFGFRPVQPSSRINFISPDIIANELVVQMKPFSPNINDITIR